MLRYMKCVWVFGSGERGKCIKGRLWLALYFVGMERGVLSEWGCGGIDGLWNSENVGELSEWGVWHVWRSVKYWECGDLNEWGVWHVWRTVKWLEWGELSEWGVWHVWSTVKWRECEGTELVECVAVVTESEMLRMRGNEWVGRVAGVTDSEMVRMRGTEWVWRVAGVTESEMAWLGGTEWVGRVAGVTKSEMVRLGELSEWGVRQVWRTVKWWDWGELSEWACGKCDGHWNGEIRSGRVLLAKRRGWEGNIKGKAYVTCLDTPYDSGNLKFPDFVITAHDLDRSAALRTGRIYPSKYSWYSFLLEVMSTLFHIKIRKIPCTWKIHWRQLGSNQRPSE